MKQITKKQLIDLHVQRYVRTVMANRLQQEGFISRDGKDIHWYRVINNEVIQSIIFYTQWRDFPISLDIGYGCHPLFLIPFFSNNAYIYAMPQCFETLHPGKPLMKPDVPTRFVFDNQTYVSCPDDLYCGADILDVILEKLNGIKTIYDCYKAHEQLYIDMDTYSDAKEVPRYNVVTVNFMDEVVYWNDTRLYPPCESVITNKLNALEEDQMVRKLAQSEQARLQMLKHAIIEGHRENHLRFLARQEVKTIKLLKQKVGIII